MKLDELRTLSRETKEILKYSQKQFFLW